MKRCNNCSCIINNLNEFETYYENQHDNTICYCQECGDDQLIYSDELEAYVYNEDYKETYLDDQISDIELFNVYSTMDLDEYVLEPDWDAIADDIKLGLL